MYKFKKGLEIKKILLKRITTPLRISKKINDMKFKFNKIYRNFYLSSTDLKKQKEIEEFQKYQTMLKYKRQNFIKNTKIYFEEKINLKEIYPNKSAKFKENNKLYFNIIINYDKKLIHQPYLFPIKKRDYIKRYYPTDPNKANIVNKIKSNSRRYGINLFGSKRFTKSFLIKSKSALNIKKRSENEKKGTKRTINRNLDTLKVDEKNRNKIIKIKKSLYMKNKHNKNNFKTPNNFLKKKLILVENNHPLKNIENIVSPIKEINDINSPNLNNINLNNLNLNIDKDKDDQNLINIQNNININNDNLILNKNIFNEKIDNSNNNLNSISNPEAKNISFKSINSISNSRNNNKESLSPHSISLKYSIETSKNKPYNFIMFNNNKKASTIEKKTINLNNINKKTISIYEQNKNAFKLLPILNKTFNSTMYKSNRLNRNIKTFRKETKIRTKYSKRKTNKITRKYFDKIVAPTIKSTLRIAKKRTWSKEMNKFIYENKNGHINFKFSDEKKKKSPLTFVEEYNRMRNRRRKNNRKITANIGFGVLPNKEIKENKLKAYFGLSFNTNKYY